MTKKTRHEIGKMERRARIVDATCGLLREAGMDAISVTMIAEHARVSPATVYNLFGTKGAILAQVFDQDLKAFERKVARIRAANALDRIFRAISIAARLYKADPGFYRATMHMKNGPLDKGLYAAMRQPRIGFWCGMLENARDDGFLKPGTDCSILGVLVTQIAAGVLADWVSNIIAADQLERETSYGFAVVLAHVSTEKGERELAGRIAALQTQLACASRLNR